MLSKIENISFQGGGVKLVAEVGACEVLEQKGILQQAKRVGGTSAGAIISTLIALGYTVAEMKQMVYELDFKTFEDGGFGETINLPVDFGINKGKVFLHFIQDKIEAKTGSKYTTFAGLKLKHGKDLTVFACNLNTGELKVFNKEHTPYIAICDAVRCSMSIPLFFEPHYLPNDTNIYVDGGCQLNYPIEFFPDETTIGVCFNVETKQPNNNLKRGEFKKYLIALLECMGNSQTVNLQQNKSAIERSIIINTNISAIDFGLTKEQKDELYLVGKNAALKFIG